MVPGDPEALRAAFEATPDHLLVLEGPELVVRAYSSALVPFVGPDAAGTPLAGLPAVARATQEVELAEEVLRTGEPRTRHDWRLALARPDGTVSENHVDLVMSPWHEPDGSVRGVVVRGTDVTQLGRDRAAAQDHYESALAVVHALQDALLPADLPILPGLDVDASYLSASEDSEAGGDWYDVVLRPSGRVALVVGDVVGNGVSASAVMGQLRAVLHDRLNDDVPLERVLTGLDRFASLREESVATTVCVVEVTRETGRLSYITAGHLPPLVVRESSAAFLPPSGATPLGTGSSFEPITALLAPGDLLLLCTDGAVERPDRDPEEGGAELSRIVAEVVAETPGDAEGRARATERVCRSGLERLARRTGHSDDITVLAAQRVEQTPALHVAVPADLTALGSVRPRLADWLAGVGARELDAIAVQHAVGEIVENAAEHAYEDEPAFRLDPEAVRLDVRHLPDGRLEVVVTDHGRWRPPRPSRTRGRGLTIARGFMDEVEIDPTDHGTTVTMRHRLTRPGELVTSAAVTPAAAREAFDVKVRDGVVTVHGPVDAASTGLLRATLLRASLGRTTAVTVDLGHVTHLGSSGVQLLFELTGDSGDLALRAPQGSVADQVLSLVGLDHAG